MLPIFIILVAALAVFYPIISRLFPLLPYRLQARPGKRRADDNVKVWVNPRSGFYYCPSSAMYGKLSPGVTMTQEKALEAGYSPAQEKHCR